MNVHVCYTPLNRQDSISSTIYSKERINKFMKKNVILMTRLIDLRVERKLTQAQLAVQISEILGRKRTLSISTISHWENGEKIPTYESLSALAEFYGVTIQYIIGESDSRTSSVPQNTPSDEIKQTTLKIPFAHLERYDGCPIYVVFDNMKYENRWGLCDFSHMLIHFIDTSMQINSKTNCSYYILKPYFDMKYDVSSSKPYDMVQMLSASIVYVKMLSSNETIRAEYEGWYHHNERKSCLIKENGLTLPYSGLGISYNAYSSGKRN